MIGSVRTDTALPMVVKTGPLKLVRQVPNLRAFAGVALGSINVYLEKGTLKVTVLCIARHRRARRCSEQTLRWRELPFLRSLVSWSADY